MLKEIREWQEQPETIEALEQRMSRGEERAVLPVGRVIAPAGSVERRRRPLATTSAVRELLSPATGKLALEIVAHFDVATYDEGDRLVHALEEVAEVEINGVGNPLLRLAEERRARRLQPSLASMVATSGGRKEKSGLPLGYVGKDMRAVARIIRTYVYERRRAAGMGWQEAIITGSTYRDHRLLVDLIAEYGSDHERKRIHASKMRGKLGMKGGLSEARIEACLNSAPRYYR